MQFKLTDHLWGKSARLLWLMIAAAVMLLGMLGGREVWTQEWRWADITWNMMYSGDYWHPYLAGSAYYDKPLLSYWVIAFFAHLFQSLNAWILRLSSALSGILAVWCIYRLGKKLINREIGFIAAWLLITTFYFIFWARTANTDTLNIAGILLALVWYFDHRENPNLKNYTVFFLIIAIASLFKGVVAAVVTFLAIIPDLMMQQQWRKSLRWSVIPSVIPALIVYLLPFLLSQHFNGKNYAENGLREVYQENFVRYFDPFDHQDPIYTYFIYLPIYLLPWAVFFIPAICSLPKRWKTMVVGSKWIAWSLLILFLFFTFSGSRRNYYTLPMVPFAILFTADWISQGLDKKRGQLAKYFISFFYGGLFLFFVVLQPLYYLGGSRDFAEQLRTQAAKIKPWSDWQIVSLDARSKLGFYLQPAKPIQMYFLPDATLAEKNRQPESYSQQELLKLWPAVLKNKSNVIFITRKLYEPKLKPILKGYTVIESTPPLGDRLLNIQDENESVAFIPIQ